jgi:glucosylglycerol-phosphate synthase
VLVNPFSRSSMDDGLDQALDMPQEERRARMQRLLAHVKQYDLGYWTRHVMRQFARLTDSAK